MSVAFCSRPVAPSTDGRAMLLGLGAVALFSLTLPFTRVAVDDLDPLFLALGRAIGAAVLAAAWLAWKRAPLPPRAALLPLSLVAGGCIVGYPLLTSIALRTVPAAHGAMLVGVLPLATTLYAAARGFERPSRGFWAMALLGSCLVVAFALVEGDGGLHAADVLLFAAVLLAAMGYAEGGRLSRSLGGPQTICWALLLAAPVLLPVLAWQGLPGAGVGARSWFAFGYVTVMSTVVGFFLWYRALALGGVARVGQVQLLQPFLSLLGAALLLGETLTLGNCLFALAVAAVVLAGRRMAVHPR